MGKSLVFKISQPADYVSVIERVKNAATKGVQSGRPFQIAMRYLTRTEIQNAKFHAMISDIHRQCLRAYSFDGVKAVLVNQFALEMEEQGTPLAHPGEKVWDWKSQEAVYVRPSTTEFLKHEAAQFIEFLYATGVDLGVRWSEKALRAYESYKEARAA